MTFYRFTDIYHDSFVPLFTNITEPLLSRVILSADLSLPFPQGPFDNSSEKYIQAHFHFQHRYEDALAWYGAAIRASPDYPAGS